MAGRAARGGARVAGLGLLAAICAAPAVEARASLGRLRSSKDIAETSHLAGGIAADAEDYRSADAAEEPARREEDGVEPEADEEALAGQEGEYDDDAEAGDDDSGIGLADEKAEDRAVDPELQEIIDSPPSSDHLKWMRETFADVDTNHDGRIQLNEIKRSLGATEARDDDDAFIDMAARMFELADADGSGSLGLRQAAKFMELFNYGVFRQGLFSNIALNQLHPMGRMANTDAQAHLHF